jgi:ADP-ribose pyrophosphatase YjhB (NUDIX family)/ribosomal protein S27AE
MAVNYALEDHVTNEIKFCQRCGERLITETLHDRERPTCPGCGHIVFLDPKLAVVVLVSLRGKLVLVRRAIEPALGRWSFPSGYVDRGESVEDAAVREVQEETGLVTRVTGFVGLYSGRDNPVVLAVYSADVTGGEMVAGVEAEDVGLYAPDELPDMPFPHDERILSDWRTANS